MWQVCPACQHVCTTYQELLQCACVRVSRALPMTLRNCSPDTLSCPPMNHCSLPCVRSQSCTRSNSLDHLSRARANSPQNRSGYSRLSLDHAAWSSLTCLSSILRQTSRTSSAHSNSYSYALAKTSARSAPVSCSKRTATRSHSAVPRATRDRNTTAYEYHYNSMNNIKN